MSDQIKHECGIALIRLLKPLEFYQKKYGSKSYGANKMYLMMEKQHNRGQDGAGLATVKMDAKPGEKYIFRERSSAKQPIQEVFTRVNERMASSNEKNGNVPFQAELLLGHVRYGTFGKNNLESVHPFLRQNNWTHRNLIVAGNFNMTNNQELFDNLVKLGRYLLKWKSFSTRCINLGNHIYIYLHYYSSFVASNKRPFYRKTFHFI